jgi:hypothetical protein
VLVVCVRPQGSDGVSRWHFDQEYGWLSPSGETSTLRDERNNNEQETKKNYLSSLSGRAYAAQAKTAPAPHQASGFWG